MLSLRPVWFVLAIFIAIFVKGDNSMVVRTYDEDEIKEFKPHHISIVGNDFMLDEQRLHIMAGSLHYFRLPKMYWRDRLRKLKAAGLNTVTTYVEWNYHEPEERQYSFEGSRNIAAFVRLAAEEGLHVILRPGPYICAERDLVRQNET